MKLAEIFAQLAYGELSQLNLGQHTDGVPPTQHHAQLVAHINLALTALHKRFLLREGRLTLELQAGRTTYPLVATAAVSYPGSRGVRYILDSKAEPFQDYILKVERVYTDQDYELGLNDECDAYACHTPSFNVLRVAQAVVDQGLNLPENYRTDTLSVVYRANHPTVVIEPGDFFPDEIEIGLPYSHMEPLLYFVASRVNNPVGMVNEFHAGNSWYAKYEQACRELEGKGYQIDQGGTNTRLERNGWV